MKQLHVIDSHTGGEPTRLVITGFPTLTGATLAQQRDELRPQHDHWRRACRLETRGNDVLVGALSCPPASAHATCAALFFNDTGYLAICRPGTIRLVA